MSTNTAMDVNKAILAAIGIHDLDNVIGVKIELSANSFPEVEIKKLELNGLAYKELTHKFELQPIEEEEDV